MKFENKKQAVQWCRKMVKETHQKHCVVMSTIKSVENDKLKTCYTVVLA